MLSRRGNIDAGVAFGENSIKRSYPHDLVIPTEAHFETTQWSDFNEAQLN
jgi:hypothetical protein